MQLWEIHYRRSNGNTGTWQEYADSRSEAIAKAEQHHASELNSGQATITSANPK